MHRNQRSCHPPRAMADSCGGAFYNQATRMAAISSGSSLACRAEVHRSSIAIAMPKNSRSEPSQPLRHNTWIQHVNHSISQIRSTAQSFQKRGRGMKVLFNWLPFL